MPLDGVNKRCFEAGASRIRVTPGRKSDHLNSKSSGPCYKLTIPAPSAIAYMSRITRASNYQPLQR